MTRPDLSFSSSSSSSSGGSSDSDGGGSAGAGSGTAKRKKTQKKASKVTRHSPELLKAGCWKYKPNGFELSQLSDDENMWMQDDVTLKVEALKGEPLFL